MAGKLLMDFALISFDSRKATKAVHDRCRQILREAVKEWVKTAEGIIPVWSGLSRASLVEIAGKVGVNIAVFPVPGAPDRRSLGEAESDGRLVELPGRYGFEYQAKATINTKRGPVNYFQINENYDATVWGFRLKKPGPYHFRDKADEAFQKVVRKRLGSFWNNFTALRQIKNAFKVRRLREG